MRFIQFQIFIIAIVFVLLTAFLQTSPITTSHFVAGKLSESIYLVTDLSSLFFLSYALLQIPNGFAFDAVGVKYILPISLILTCVGCVLYWQADNGIILAISRFTIGIGCSTAYVGAIFIAAQYFNNRYLPLLVSIIEASASFGSYLSDNMYSNILVSYGWDIANILLIVLLLFLTCYALICSKFIASAKKTRTVVVSSLFQQLCILFRNPHLRWLLLYSFFTWQVIMTFAGFWAKQYYQVMYHYSRSNALSIVELYWLSYLAGALIVGFCVKELQAIRVTMVTLAFLGVFGYGVLALPSLLSENVVLFATVFCGVSASGVVLSFSMIAHMVDKDNYGIAVSLNNTMIVLGGFLGQIAFGKVISTFNFDAVYPIGKLDGHLYSGILMLLVSTLCALGCIMRVKFFVKQRATSTALV